MKKLISIFPLLYCTALFCQFSPDSLIVNLWKKSDDKSKYVIANHLLKNEIEFKKENTIASINQKCLNNRMNSYFAIIDYCITNDSSSKKENLILIAALYRYLYKDKIGDKDEFFSNFHGYLDLNYKSVFINKSKKNLEKVRDYVTIIPPDYYANYNFKHDSILIKIGLEINKCNLKSVTLYWNILKNSFVNYNFYTINAIKND